MTAIDRTPLGELSALKARIRVRDKYANIILHTVNVVQDSEHEASVCMNAQ